MESKVDVAWKDPEFDPVFQLEMQSAGIYVKNMSSHTSTLKIKEMFSKFGNISKIFKYTRKAIVVFESIHSAQEAREAMNNKRVDGCVWKIHAAKKFDELRMKEQPDKNLIFSINFLDMPDKLDLKSIVASGSLPEDGLESVAMMATNICQNAIKRQQI